MNQDGLEFPARFDQEFVLQDRQRGYFGRNVLKGLVDGMEGFLEEKRRTPAAYDGGILLKSRALTLLEADDLRKAVHRVLDVFAEAAELDRELAQRWARFHAVQAALSAVQPLPTSDFRLPTSDTRNALRSPRRDSLGEIRLHRCGVRPQSQGSGQGEVSGYVDVQSGARDPGVRDLVGAVCRMPCA